MSDVHVVSQQKLKQSNVHANVTRVVASTMQRCSRLLQRHVLQLYSSTVWPYLGTMSVLGFSKLLLFFFDMGCVYNDTCSTVHNRKLNTYNFKNLTVGSGSDEHARA
jgi:hypothetical protein